MCSANVQCATNPKLGRESKKSTIPNSAKCIYYNNMIKIL